MQTNSLNGRIYFVVLLAILLMLHAQADDLTLTSSQPQNDDFDLFSGFHLGDPPAGSFGNLLGPGDSKVGSDWAMGEAGLKLNSNSQAEKTLSPLLAEASIACPNRSRLRRSRLGMRDQRDDSRCQSPYSRTTTTTTPEAQQGAPTPDKQQEGRPWPKLTDSTGETELWLQLYTARGVEGEANLKVCNRHGLFPVCYPYKVPAIPPLVSPALIVEPCRFWSELDQCKLDLEELWCCQYAKERPVDDIISTSVSALSFNFYMRYRGAGLECETLDNPEVNNLGRGW